MIADGGEGEHEDEFTGPATGGEGAGDHESGADHEDVEQVDPGAAACSEVLVQMIDDDQGTEAECDVGREVVEPDGQEEGAEDQEVKKGDEGVRIHLVVAGGKGAGVSVLLRG